MKLTDTQTRALDRLKKAIEAHKAKPTSLTADVLRKQYNLSLNHTLSPTNLSEAEVEVLKSVTNS